MSGTSSQPFATCKRPRVYENGTENGDQKKSSTTNLLQTLLLEGKWEEALSRVESHPEDATSSCSSSPLALSCRLGAPAKCVHAIWNACPSKLRHVIDSRGTPLHEAIVACGGSNQNNSNNSNSNNVSVIQLLLQADETMQQQEHPATTTAATQNTRATLLQDVDGFTPLHLLIRQRFQAQNLMQILELLVASCPEAVLIPDRGEYEEPPIIYALKANIYSPEPAAAPSSDSVVGTMAHVERQIYEMVACMLKYCPEAASRVFTGYRGQYTALHSAVFHGRNSNTIELLLKTEARQRQRQGQTTTTSSSSSSSSSSLGNTNCILANTQGEVPLHFCAMRGERPRSVALLANAAPQAVMKRDACGLTPLHWLWVRFVGNLLALDRLALADDTTNGPLRIVRPRPPSKEPHLQDATDADYNNVYQDNVYYYQYSAFASLEQGDFELDLQLIKRMDPPVDFLRMRHIPMEVMERQQQQHHYPWAKLTVQILTQLRDRYNNNAAKSKQEEQFYVWKRQECVVALFWTKVVSLIQASVAAQTDTTSNKTTAAVVAPRGTAILTHAAFASPACLAPVCRIVASLFPHELQQPDFHGRLPLHYAAARPLTKWDLHWPRQDNGGCGHGRHGAAGQTYMSTTATESSTAAIQLLHMDTIEVICLAVKLTMAKSMTVLDSHGRLPLHDLIDNICSNCVREWPLSDETINELLALVDMFIEKNQVSLQYCDGQSKLYPFLQAAATAAATIMTTAVANHHHHHHNNNNTDSSFEKLTLSISYRLLRENPSTIVAMI